MTDGSPATKAAQKATTTVPIVFVSGNPVGQGFVASLSRPRGNLTGVAIIAGDLNPKRIRLLKEAIPAMIRLAILEDQSAVGLAPNDARLAGNWQAIETASRQLGIQLTLARGARTSEDLEGAFALAARDRAGGVLVLPSAFFAAHITHIVGFIDHHKSGLVELAAKHRIPTIYAQREFVVGSGGLMSYGADYHHLFRRAATYVDKILKGAKPTDLPIEQPTKFELVINLKTAKALGLTIPPSMLARADEVIQ